MAIKEYSCTRDGEKFLGPNFRVREFSMPAQRSTAEHWKKFLESTTKRFVLR